MARRKHAMDAWCIETVCPAIMPSISSVGLNAASAAAAPQGGWMRPRGLRIDQHLQPLAVHQPDRTAGKRDVIGCRGRHDGDFGLRCRDGFRDYWKRTNPGEWLFLQFVAPSPRRCRSHIDAVMLSRSDARTL